MNNIRIFFRKTDRAIYISHLDLYRTMQRAMCRAKMPIWQTQGFNPHMYLTFALPLALGTSGVCESMDAKLTEEVSPEDVMSRLNAVLPRDLQVIRVAEPVKKHTEIAEAEYEIDTGDDLSDFNRFMQAEKMPVEKKTKRGLAEIDLKPMIKLISAEPGKLIMRLPAGIETNINPQLVFQAYTDFCGHEPEKLNVKRTLILCTDGSVFE